MKTETVEKLVAENATLKKTVVALIEAIGHLEAGETIPSNIWEIMNTY